MAHKSMQQKLKDLRQQLMEEAKANADLGKKYHNSEAKVVAMQQYVKQQEDEHAREFAGLTGKISDQMTCIRNLEMDLARCVAALEVSGCPVPGLKNDAFADVVGLREAANERT